MMVQVMMCYICWTLGASNQLKTFDCCIIEDGKGGYIIRYKLKDNTPQAIGDSFVESDLLHEDTESEMEVEDNDFTRGSLWQNRKRGLSLQNKIDCDEIMQQFLMNRESISTFEDSDL